MNNSTTHNQRIAKLTFASVYPLYLTKIEKKGRADFHIRRGVELNPLRGFVVF